MIGFVYLWRDRRRNMYYLGSHCGTVDDGYIGSSRWFQNAYKKRSIDFKRKIIEVINDGVSQNVRTAEQYWLSFIKADEFGVKYYNFNSRAGGIDSVTARKGALKVHEKKNDKGKSIHAVAIHFQKNEEGKSIVAIKAAMANNIEKDEYGKSLTAIVRGRASHRNKNEEGKSIHAIRTLVKVNDAKDDDGKSIVARKGGRTLHLEKDDSGRSIYGIKRNSEKDEEGKSIIAKQGGYASHSKKDEKGKSIHGIRVAEIMHLRMGEMGMRRHGQLMAHFHWHIKRNIVNPKCEYCGR